MIERKVQIMQKIVYVQSNAGDDGLEEVNKLLAEGIWTIDRVSPCALSHGSSAYITLVRPNTREENNRHYDFVGIPHE